MPSSAVTEAPALNRSPACESLTEQDHSPLPRLIYGKIAEEYYTAYLVISVGIPRDHHAIFIKEPVDGPGRIYQVTGNSSGDGV